MQAGGLVGKPTVAALLSAGFKVTILSRSGSSDAFPSDVKVIKADYDSIESLTSALAGIDAVVSTVGAPGLKSQGNVIEAAVRAGVKRFIPSEYGCDTLNEKTSKFPVFAAKVETQTLLKEKAAKDELEYTFLPTGGFLDLGVYDYL